MKKDIRLTHLATRTLVAGCISMGMAVAAAEETTTVDSTGDDTVTDPVVETHTIGRSTNVEAKLTAEFSDFLGGDENAANVVESLRTGKALELDAGDNTGDGGDTTTTGAVTTADSGTQAGSADPAPETPTDLPTATMGYGNVRLTLRLAEAQFEKMGIQQPTNEELSAMLLGGNIGETQYQGILNQRAAGEGWGQIAKSYDFKVGQLMGKAPAKPVVEPVAEPTMQDTATTSTRSNGYIPSGKTKFTYAGDKSGTPAPKTHGAKRNGYIPSGSTSPSTAANHGNGNLKVKGSGARKNGYIPSGNAGGSGSGIVSAHGAASGAVKTNHGQSKGQMKGYIASGAGGHSAGIVSATNASATAAVSAAGGQGHGKGNAKGHGKSK